MSIEKKRLLGAAALATALHGVLLFVVSRSSDGERATGIALPTEALGVEIALWPETAEAKRVLERHGQTSRTVSRDGAARRREAPVAVERGATGSEAILLPEATRSDVATDTPLRVDPSERPSISLAQAGYGAPSPWALPGVSAASEAEQAEGRLERNLAESAMRLDYQRSAGIEGPFVVALNRSAWGNVPPNSRARISVTIDSNGKVSAIDVVETNDGMASWREVSARVAANLAAHRVRVPPGRGVELVFEVESQVLMPSGRKPMEGFSVLGIPIGKKDPRKEAAIRILEPHVGIGKITVPKAGVPDEDIELPVLRAGVQILSVAPELVDLAAPAQQVVHTKLVKQRVL